MSDRDSMRTPVPTPGIRVDDYGARDSMDGRPSLDGRASWRTGATAASAATGSSVGGDARQGAEASSTGRLSRLLVGGGSSGGSRTPSVRSGNSTHISDRRDSATTQTQTQTQARGDDTPGASPDTSTNPDLSDFRYLSPALGGGSISPVGSSTSSAVATNATGGGLQPPGMGTGQGSVGRKAGGMMKRFSSIVRREAK